MKLNSYLKGLVMGLVLAQSVSAAVITVTTTNNVNPGAGQTSLVMALQNAQAGDTIAFNIPGPGPHYIETPTNGYPRIEKDGITIDGYTQPGSSPNTNPIRAANNAKLKIVLDSRKGGRTVMNYNTGRSGYGDSETAIIGVFNASNVSIRGLCFLGLHTGNSDQDPAIYCVAFARDHSGSPDFDDNGHVSGCWFGVEPDGTSVTGGSATAVAAFRHRDVTGGPLPELPNKNLTIGVKAGSANPRAEFNVMVDMSYHLAGEQTGARFSGNFLGVLPDGKTPYDMVALNKPFAGASLEIGRYNDTTILIGTDGDGVNDADEGNVFGPLSNGSVVLAFYGTGNKQFIIAGNYFGVAVDGKTAFPGSFKIAERFDNGCSVRFGSDFNGVSDDLEANLVVNNHPFDPAGSIISPIGARTGAKLSVRGNRLINNYPIPVNVAGGADPNPADFYTPVLANPAVIQPVITSATGTELKGTAPVPLPSFVTTIIDVYAADPEGIANGKTLGIPELPNGFVQGKRYLGSFADNSAQDKDPAAGAFTFNATGISLAGNITITANYSEQPRGTANAAFFTTPFSEPMLVQTLPSKPEENGLTPASGTFYINTADTINNGRTESLGIAIANNGNVIIGWEDDGSELNDLEAVWTMFDSSGRSIIPETKITTIVPPGGSITNKFLSYFRTDGSAVPGYTSWGPKIKANLFGEGVGMGATSFALGDEVAELLDIQNDAGGGGDWPTVQLLSNTGAPRTILSGVPDAHAETAGNIRIGDWDYLSNGNVVIVGESRQNDDLTTKFGGATANQHAIYRIMAPGGNPFGVEVKPVSLVSEVPERTEIWHGVGVTRDGFAVRFAQGGRTTIRLFRNDGTPASGNIDLGNLTGNAVAAAGGRGDGTGFHGNGKDAYVVVSGGVDEDGLRQVWLTVLNADGTVRYSRAASDDVTLQNIGRMDAAIDESGRVIVVYDDPSGTGGGARLVMGRIFDPTGRPVGKTFYVSEKELPLPTTLETQHPRASWRGNQVAITWQSRNSGTTENRVVAARFFTVAGGAGVKLSVTAVGPNTVTLAWTGGTGPFLLQKKGTLNDASWMNVLTTSNRTAVVPRDGFSGFFRIVENATVQVTPLSVFMGGTFEKPNAVTTPASGLGTLSIEGNKLSYDISFTGLTAPASAAHIHGYGNTTESKGVVIPFTATASTAGRIMGSVTLTEEQRTNILAGRTYANLHTSANTGGEIRGQIAQSNLKVVLNGANERPNPVTTSASGTGTATLVGDQLFLDISYSGLSGAATGAHIHGPATTGESASVLVNIQPLHVGAFGASGSFKGSVTLTPQQLSHVIDGLTYVNIHTTANSGGEIRGQIVP